MDMEKLARELQGKQGLADAANSPEARHLAEQLDAAALQDAARRGDAGALKQLLSRVLATPEGKALAEQVKKAVEQK